MKGKIVAIDDELSVVQMLEKTFSMFGYDIKGFSSPSEALKHLGKHDVDLVISDVRMPEMMGDEVLSHIKQHHPQVGVIFITGHGNISHAVLAVRSGAFDYITKPFDTSEIMARVNAFFSMKEKLGGQLPHHAPTPSYAPVEKSPATSAVKATATPSTAPANASLRYEIKLVGQNEHIKNILNVLPQIAQNNAPVLIQGESGTGKEVFASLIHHNSERVNKPYIKINCANLPSELVESTLFGHIKGAFTGAITDAKGAFDEADGGTLLLDEITEIDINVQAKLLRVLQEKEFTRVGSQKTNKVDVRIIATTNRNVMQSIQEGKFREDLYYRLNVFPIRLPSLRDRKDDIPVLAEYFVEKYAAEHGLPAKTMTAEVVTYLRTNDWKGNVRELSNMIQRGVLMSGKAETIEMHHIKNALFDNVDEEIKKELMDELPLVPIEEMELKMIRLALEKTDGNQKEAADLLGISDRTIRNKLKKIKDIGS